MKKETILLIDGSGLVFRAFYALPPLTALDGTHVNAVYGFANMIQKLMERFKPEYVAVAFDLKGPTFRHKEYKEYKATRKKAPDELLNQFAVVKEFCDRFGLSRFEQEGFEADDLVGTMAKLAEEAGYNVEIITGDKDYLQLVTEITTVHLTRRGITELESYNPEALDEKYGLTAEQFLELKGLMGDPSDNIPGVPGVGEKTGIKLLKAYGTIDGVYENLDQLKGKMKEKIEANHVQALMSLRLSRIINDVQMDFKWEDLKQEVPDDEALYQLYKKLNFKSLMKKFENRKIENGSRVEGDLVVEAEAVAFTWVDDARGLQVLMTAINQAQYVIMHSRVNGGRHVFDDLIDLGLRIKDVNYLVDVRAFSQLEMMSLLQVLGEKRLIGHRLVNESLMIMRYGGKVMELGFDTAVAQYLVHPEVGKYPLRGLGIEVADRVLPADDDFYGKGRKKVAWADMEKAKRGDYLAQCLVIIDKAVAVLEARMKEESLTELYQTIELPLVRILAKMEKRGVAVDESYLKILGDKFKVQIADLETRIFELSEGDFNLNSPKQLGVVLFETLGLPVIKKTKTGYSTNAEVLDKLGDAHPIIPLILEYRKLTKLNSTYVEGLTTATYKGRIHSHFTQTIASTGRLSSIEPNIQNIPVKTKEGRELRRVFVASEGMQLVDADYSQIELRVLAHISGDENLIRAYNEKLDIHTQTAAEVFHLEQNEVTPLMRSRAKAVNFGIVYGISDYGLARDLKISNKEAKAYIEGYLEHYPGVAKYMKDVVEEGKGKGYVETLFNRKRWLPDLNAKNHMLRSFAERTAMNTPIQGTAADIIKIAMIRVDQVLEKENLKTQMILQVHDELILDAPANEVERVTALLKEAMEEAVSLSIPMDVDLKVGGNWYETK
jgi:DNA polymerase-1